MIRSIDHLVLPTRDLERCLAFYTGALGMRLETFGAGRIALRFGDQKINVHPPGLEGVTRAAEPLPGALDLCFLADRALEQVIARLGQSGVTIEEGPVVRSGARFPIRSVYAPFRR